MRMEQGRILVITGAPGTGKTTISSIIAIKFNYFHWSLSNNITATYKNNVRYKGYPNIARFLALQRKYTIGSSLRFHTIPSALEIYPAVQTSYLFKSDSLIFNLCVNDR